jgi:multicomponent K+:H+ antiporter subunit G
MSPGAPPWVEVAVAALLVLSGGLALISAFGLLRLRDFFVRMHPPAIAYTAASWCVAVAGALYFSALHASLRLHPLLIGVINTIAIPLTTLLLARAALFRRRVAGVADTPPPLSARRA